MSFPRLEKAKLIELDHTTGEPGTNELVLDFNPETLSIGVSNSLENSGRGTNAIQVVKETVSTLSFDALFDTTHAKAPFESSSQEDDGPKAAALDVRRRTRKLVALLDSSAQRDGDKKPAPARVRFVWGSVVFDGVFSSYSETLEYFSPEGIPLRARVSVELTEQRYQYQIKQDSKANLRPPGASAAADPAQRGQEEPGLTGAPLSAPGGARLSAPGGARFRSPDLARAAGASTGFEADVSLDPRAEVSFGFEAALQAEVGTGVDAEVAFNVFGENLPGASGRGNISQMRSTPPQRAGADSRATPWATDGPRPGSQAAGIAARVVQNRRRAGAKDFVGTDKPADSLRAQELIPAPIKGSAPTRVTVFGQPPTSVYGGPKPAKSSARSGPRPRWEADIASDNSARTPFLHMPPECLKRQLRRMLL